MTRRDWLWLSLLAAVLAGAVQVGLHMGDEADDTEAERCITVCNARVRRWNRLSGECACAVSRCEESR